MPRWTTQLAEERIRWQPIAVLSSVFGILVVVLFVIFHNQPVIHGNVKSKVYHLPGCYWYNCTNCTARFSTAREAERAGYRLHGGEIQQPLRESR